MPIRNKTLLRLSGLTFKVKLALGLTAMLALFVSVALYNLQQVGMMKAYLKQQNDKVELKLMALELKEMVQELNIIASGLEISKKADYIPTYNEKRKVFDGMITKIGDTASTPEQAKWRSQLISLTVDYTNTFDVAAKLVQEKSLSPADLDKNMEYLYNESQRLMSDIFLNVDHFYIAYSEDAQEAIAGTEALLHRTELVMWAASALVFVAGAAIAALLIRSFARPIRRLQQAVHSIAAGDLRSRIGSSSRDELGELSRSFDRMADQVRGMIAGTRGIASTLSGHSGSLHRFSVSTAAANADIIRAIQEIASGADQQATQSEQGAYLISELEREIETISEYAATVQQKSREAALNTHTGSASMESLRQAAHASEAVLDKVYAAMAGLSGSTVQIHHIVNTITDISHQTNVLALNAAIEAARAGVHGRGFSVIAEEVRQLSSQTNESSRSIAAIIRSLLDQTKELETYLGGARQSFEQQSGKMNESLASFGQIRASMDELSGQIDRIQEQIAQAKDKNGKLVGSVQFVAAIAQETAAAVEEVNSTSIQQDASIQRIAGQADDMFSLSQKLFDEISRFQIDEAGTTAEPAAPNAQHGGDGNNAGLGGASNGGAADEAAKTPERNAGAMEAQAEAPLRERTPGKAVSGEPGREPEPAQERGLSPVALPGRKRPERSSPLSPKRRRKGPVPGRRIPLRRSLKLLPQRRRKKRSW
ncbi:Methyl-accepting chemotaxis protein McpC [Paenibacillus konkukensis]|uniref:Methyl-accepting chemotaxis protein McpC n=1 Tax=Paenibacillus konkukensis TaxID=2020716 RepID=A0ABY4RLZ7_9BACL|nr:methyl-accepting chemotaxis protein [Paenibacillus konkukensis]UQZ83045.1 Methyl-accepting chemotaxis protein McpC [Paenibacillus konkukensis]